MGWQRQRQMVVRKTKAADICDVFRNLSDTQQYICCSFHRGKRKTGHGMCMLTCLLHAGRTCGGVCCMKARIVNLSTFPFVQDELVVPGGNVTGQGKILWGWL